MKTLYLFIGIAFYSLTLTAQTDTTTLYATCCEDGRGCKGSAYCTACKNCSACKHCAKNGGSCGVCSSNRSYTPAKKANTIYFTPSKSTKFIIGGLLLVNTTSLNLREAPTTNSKIIERLESEDKLELLEILDSWLKVKALKSNQIGYVYSKFVKTK